MTVNSTTSSPSLPLCSRASAAATATALLSFTVCCRARTLSTVLNSARLRQAYLLLLTAARTRCPLLNRLRSLSRNQKSNTAKWLQGRKHNYKTAWRISEPFFESLSLFASKKPAPFDKGAMPTLL